MIWIRENSRGHELWRGVHRGDVPEVGSVHGHSSVDGRPWIVLGVVSSKRPGRLHVSKDGKLGSPRLVFGHHMTVPSDDQVSAAWTRHAGEVVDELLALRHQSALIDGARFEAALNPLDEREVLVADDRVELDHFLDQLLLTSSPKK